MKKMKHIVFYSGGIGSWATAKRVIAEHGKENTILLFTDTLIEDDDLYRFIDETVKEMDATFIKIEDGRTPWDIFEQERFLGNSRIANCSTYLKRNMSGKWLRKKYKPDECVLYFGFDWTEIHRTEKAQKNWHPYKVEFPMTEEPYVTKDEMLKELNDIGIETPRLYELGFKHNNCGGFCVRAGQGHFVHLLKTLPERFKEHEEMEQKVIKLCKERHGEEKDFSILTRQKNGQKMNFTLKQLREEYEQDESHQIDLFDIGGCGCFVDN